MHDIIYFRTEIKNRQLELKDRLEKIKGDISKSHSSDWSDQAQERENDEVLNQLGLQVEEELKEIAAALTRVELDTYGFCLHCENQIAAARLEIKPETPYCADCAKLH